MSGLTITRRPWTDCPFRWTLEVEDVSGGEGDVSEAQCLDLNGTFTLNHKPCESRGRLLVWETECEGAAGCGDCRVDFTVYRPEVTIDCGPDGPFTFPEYTYVIPYSGSCYWAIDVNQGGLLSTIVIRRGTPSEPFTLDLTLSAPGTNGGTAGPYVSTSAHYAARPGATCDDPGWFDFLSASEPPMSGFSCYSTNAVPATLHVTSSPSTIGATGPEVNDRTRGRWRLEWDIASETFTLHSFERIIYPQWTLVDAEPCVGLTKTLTLAERPEGAEDGCGTAPAEVTLTRACNPERPPRERNDAGKGRRTCCDCQDEVDDSRYGCQEKCEDTETEGCETYDEEQIECKYPKSADACDYCPEDTAPCAYEVLFGPCDISHEGISIAAKNVVLRHRCFFEDSCDWVAPGPEYADQYYSEQIGGTGAEPSCASCSDICLTGCSWDAWVVAECSGHCNCPAPEGAEMVMCLQFPSVEWTTRTSPDGNSLGQQTVGPPTCVWLGSMYESVDETSTLVFGRTAMFRSETSQNSAGLTIGLYTEIGGGNPEFQASYESTSFHCRLGEDVVFTFVNDTSPSPQTTWPENVVGRWSLFYRHSDGQVVPSCGNVSSM